MNSDINAIRLAEYLSSLSDFNLASQSYGRYKHMGAILSDAILQAGLNYKSVVAPRITRLIKQHPNAITTSSFLSIINHVGANQVLNWRHPEKPRRLLELTMLLTYHSVETDQDLHDWLLNPMSSQYLLALKGIGPKTIDYLKNLVNISTVAVDRHIIKFVESAGIVCNGYSETKSVVEQAAVILCVQNSQLDHAIWLYMSERNTQKI